MAKYYGDIAKSAKGAWEIDDDGGGGETRGREDGLREDRGDAREGDDARGARTTKD
jgi:hypothetical protein